MSQWRLMQESVCVLAAQAAEGAISHDRSGYRIESNTPQLERVAAQWSTDRRSEARPAPNALRVESLRYQGQWERPLDGCTLPLRNAVYFIAARAYPTRACDLFSL